MRTVRKGELRGGIVGEGSGNEGREIWGVEKYGRLREEG